MTDLETPVVGQPQPSAPPVAPNINTQSLLARAGVPSLTNPPASRLEGDNVHYSIVTTSPNSPEMKAALENLRDMGCTVEIDYESLVNFTMIAIDAPRHLIRPEEWDALLLQEETRRKAIVSASGLTEKPAGVDFLPTEESC